VLLFFSRRPACRQAGSRRKGHSILPRQAQGWRTPSEGGQKTSCRPDKTRKIAKGTEESFMIHKKKDKLFFGSDIQFNRKARKEGAKKRKEGGS
jgi:hypothetical protein